MHPAIQKLERTHLKKAIPQVQSGDTVRVHQRIREGNKQRIQVFEGVVIRTHRLGSLSATITVRRIASGIGVEKTYLLHSPNVDKVQIMRRAKVRRNYLSFLRERRGKSARLKEIAFDRAAANAGTPLAEDEVPAEDPIADQPVEDPDLEIDPEQVEDESAEVDVSTEELAKEENKEARADEPKPTDGGTDEGDEDVKREEEFEKGVDRAQPNNE